jgi:hypothetical protein
VVPLEQRLSTHYDARGTPNGCAPPRHFSGDGRITLVVMVNLTRIYTRTGDGGTTRLGDMSETTKNDLRLHAYADVD